jgi:hypothetical protein
MRVVSAGAGSLREDVGGPPWPIPRVRGCRERKGAEAELRTRAAAAGVRP